ncbi:hypothetical protein JTE90_014313 [Oedothorax gibbosus]|uniref:Uncharacterized protein n=1 Tax=Oedothorax gibbosus TaxID=931172 RepID=A0AAV6UVC6_9ARAC|nr:hypothetical protein JTE90_014313 [Oedothorax gibbosus]
MIIIIKATHKEHYFFLEKKKRRRWDGDEVPGSPSSDGVARVGEMVEWGGQAISEQEELYHSAREKTQNQEKIRRINKKPTKSGGEAIIKLEKDEKQEMKSRKIKNAGFRTNRVTQQEWSIHYCVSWFR